MSIKIVAENTFKPFAEHGSKNYSHQRRGKKIVGIKEVAKKQSTKKNFK